MTRRHLFVFCAVISIPLDAEAGDAIVVSATRLPDPARDVGATVTIIDRAAIEQSQSRFLVEALRAAPGVSTAETGGPGGVASVRLRGASSGQTLVVRDGIVVNDPAAPQGAYDFAAFDSADVGQVEILAGPQGLVWGADAIGGVVAIEGRRPDGPLAEGLIEGGRYGAVRAAATLGAGAAGGAFAIATVGVVRTDGFSRAASGTEPDGLRSFSLSAAGGAPLTDSLDGEAFLRYGRRRADIDGFPPPDFQLGDTRDRETAENYSVGGRLRHRGGAARGEFTLSWNGLSRRGEDGAGAALYESDGGRLAASYVGRIDVGGGARVTVGGDAQRTAIDASGVDESARRGGVFALAEWRTTPVDGSKLVLSAGARHDAFSEFGGATTARVSAVWAFDGPLAPVVRANWGSGFRAPSLFELHYDEFGVTPNPDLKPERAEGADLGVEASAGPVTARVTAFLLRTRDLIDFSFARFGYYNVGRARSRGVEFAAAWRPARAVSLEAAYTLADAVDLDTGAQLLRQPRHRGSATITLSPTPRWTLAAALFANGRENDAPAPNAAFARVDLRAAFRASRRVELYGRIENLGDARYQDVSGYAETGRAGYAGARLRL